jgi:hypothetical protein
LWQPISIKISPSTPCAIAQYSHLREPLRDAVVNEREQQEIHPEQQLANGNQA